MRRLRAPPNSSLCKRCLPNCGASSCGAPLKFLSSWILSGYTVLMITYGRVGSPHLMAETSKQSYSFQIGQNAPSYRYAVHGKRWDLSSCTSIYLSPTKPIG